MRFLSASLKCKNEKTDSDFGFDFAVCFFVIETEKIQHTTYIRNILEWKNSDLLINSGKCGIFVIFLKFFFHIDECVCIA